MSCVPQRLAALALPAVLLGSLTFPAGATEGTGDSLPGEAPVDFARDVRPILSDKCFQCHGPDPETRASGLRLDTHEGATAKLSSGGHAVISGNLEDSELVYRIDPEFEEDRMPPGDSGKSLDDREREILRRWIEEGAAWGTHWSFEPYSVGDAPGNADDAIDAYVGARLGEAGLTLQPGAQPDVLLRRVALDLTGLPPTPRERAGFRSAVERDGLDAAYAAEVDRLLASERYGVHMARTWLDAARYADTHGLHLDNERSMWPYRDWVVDALNENMPFDQFTIEQLAGDLLPGATLDQRIASGFNRCNPTSAEGGMIGAEYLSIYAKDRADTTATVFLGLTLACAQCHDHKFDPLSQRDYYGMYAFFNSLNEEATDRNIPNPRPFVGAPTAAQTQELAAMGVRAAALQAELDAPNPELDAKEAKWSAEQHAEVSRAWRVLLPESAEATGGAELAVDTANGEIIARGENPAKVTYTVSAWVPAGSIQGIRLDALVPEGSKLPGRATNENFVLNHFEAFVAPSGTDAWTPVELGTAAATHSQTNWPVADALDPDTANGWAGLGLEGPRSAVFLPTEGVGYPEGTELRIVLHFESVHQAHAFSRFRFAVKRSNEAPPERRYSTWFRASFGTNGASGLYDAPFPPDRQIPLGIDVLDEAGPGVAWTPEPGYTPGKVHALSTVEGAHYFVQRIWASRAHSAELRFGSDDGIRAWLRGEEILRNDVPRGAALDQEIVPVHLHAGVNELVVKVVNTGGAGGFAWSTRGGLATGGLATDVELALQRPDTERTTAERDAVRLHFRKTEAPGWAAAFQAREALLAEIATFEGGFPTTMVSSELEMRRPAHIQMRGAYDKLGDIVEPATPAVLPPMPEGAPRNRLGLARWIVSGENPLTARVWVNRAWQHFFGRGLVATPEDFGNQGAWPSHPELLDWLATSFVDSGWDQKAMHRRIALSKAYRQRSHTNPGLLEADPDGALITRGPRGRLEGEVLRDQALHLAGLLDETMGGPGVKPYQPDGVWFAVGYSGSNTVRYAKGPTDHLHRRSLYTFWKRTAPPPNLTTFDAPMRDACTVRRERTNTPLQALVTLNDPTYVEAARFLALNAMGDASPDSEARAAALFDRVVGRPGNAGELARITALVTDLRAAYADAPDDAEALTGVGDLPTPEGVDRVELAAWTLTASALLNLDEVLNKN